MSTWNYIKKKNNYFVYYTEIHKDFYFKSAFGFERNCHVIVEIMNNELHALKFENHKVEKYKYKCEGVLKNFLSSKLFKESFEKKIRNPNYRQ